MGLNTELEMLSTAKLRTVFITGNVRKVSAKTITNVITLDEFPDPSESGALSKNSMSEVKS